MAKTELRKEFEALLKKVDIQKELLEKKVVGVDTKAAVDDASLYESFMPVVDEYLDDLAFVSNKIYEVIEQFNDRIVSMYNEIEGSFTDIPEEDFVDPPEETEPVILTAEDEKEIFTSSEDPIVEVDGNLPDDDSSDQNDDQTEENK